MHRVISGIERDFEENIKPWLYGEILVPGDPPDRAIESIERLLEIVHEITYPR